MAENKKEYLCHYILKYLQQKRIPYEDVSDKVDKEDDFNKYSTDQTTGKVYIMRLKPGLRQRALKEYLKLLSHRKGCSCGNCDYTIAFMRHGINLAFPHNVKRDENNPTMNHTAFNYGYLNKAFPTILKVPECSICLTSILETGGESLVCKVCQSPVCGECLPKMTGYWSKTVKCPVCRHPYITEQHRLGFFWSVIIDGLKNLLMRLMIDNKGSWIFKFSKDDDDKLVIKAQEVKKVASMGMMREEVKPLNHFIMCCSKNLEALSLPPQLEILMDEVLFTAEFPLEDEGKDEQGDIISELEMYNKLFEYLEKMSIFYEEESGCRDAEFPPFQFFTTMFIMGFKYPQTFNPFHKIFIDCADDEVPALNPNYYNTSGLTLDGELPFVKAPPEDSESDSESEDITSAVGTVDLSQFL